MKKPTKDLDFINEKGDPLKVEKGTEPLRPSKHYSMSRPVARKPKPQTVGQAVRSGQIGEAKRMVSTDIENIWAGKKPNLPKSETACKGMCKGVCKCQKVEKFDTFEMTDEGHKVLKEMKKRFDKAVAQKTKKADLQGPVECAMFKSFEDLANNLHKWDGPDLKKKSEWKMSPHNGGEKHVHPVLGTIVNRGGEFHAAPHGKEYYMSVHPSLEEAKNALKKPQK